jgi:DNA-binding response OmpR family regulator
MQILIVEDESTIREVEKAYLERAGYSVLEAEDGEKALDLFSHNKVDLVLLDLNLPKVDGINVCKQIRALSGVPIMMVTARVEEMDELIGLEIGADDYIKKPFSPSVLVARVQALLRRIGEAALKIGDLEIDPEKMTVTRSGKLINLTTTQFNILYTLARTPGKVFTRDQIMEHAYNDPVERDVLDRTIDVHIKSIRKLLETDPKNPKYILTMIGKGYKFNEG